MNQYVSIQFYCARNWTLVAERKFDSLSRWMSSTESNSIKFYALIKNSSYFKQQYTHFLMDVLWGVARETSFFYLVVILISISMERPWHMTMNSKLLRHPSILSLFALKRCMPRLLIFFRQRFITHAGFALVFLNAQTVCLPFIQIRFMSYFTWTSLCLCNVSKREKIGFQLKRMF